MLPEPPPKCLFIEFGESALKLQLRFWIADAQNGVQNVKSEVLLRIWEMFPVQQTLRAVSAARSAHSLEHRRVIEHGGSSSAGAAGLVSSTGIWVLSEFDRMTRNGDTFGTAERAR